jgi:hypothetical protein
VEADERMRARLGEGAVQAAVELVPAGWFAVADPPAVYAEYLSRRLARGGFVEEAERARAGR